MNRQIKFKAKVLKHNPMTNPDNGWVEGFYFQDLCGGDIKHFIKGGEMEWEVNSDTIGQFTGLVDRNGKEIYEGDIILVYDNPNPLVVRWNNEYCQFELCNEIETEARGFISLNVVQYIAVDLEVIGNIHNDKIKEI